MRRFVAVVLLAASIAGAATASASAPPRGLTSYGRITWNLDALVRDFYGGARTCFRVQTFSIHRCRQPGYNDGLYQATFAAARGSAFRAVRRSNPLGAVNVVGIKIGGRYIACGNGTTWLGITNAPAGWGEAVACVRP
jgi:hypothetical protein